MVRGELPEWHDRLLAAVGREDAPNGVRVVGRMYAAAVAEYYTSQQLMLAAGSEAATLRHLEAMETLSGLQEEIGAMLARTALPEFEADYWFFARRAMLYMTATAQFDLRAIRARWRREGEQ